MLNIKDSENLTKSTHTSEFLISDLEDLGGSENQLVAELARELLRQAKEIEQKLKALGMET